MESRSVEHELLSVLTYHRFHLSMVLLYSYCILLGISLLCLSYLVFRVLSSRISPQRPD